MLTRLSHLKGVNKVTESHIYLPEMKVGLLTSLKEGFLNEFFSIVFFTGSVKIFPQSMSLVDFPFINVLNLS